MSGVSVGARRGAAALACAVALGACGDDGGGSLSKTEYEQRFRDIVSESENAASDGADAQTPQEQAEQIDTGLDRVRSMASELGELEPPDEIARAHAQYVAALRAVADDAEKLVAALRAGQVRRADAMLDRGFANPATVRKIALARREFDAKGYDLGEVSQFP
jgi:hypothetical protein